MPRDLPTGTVTFLFSDVQGSTKLLHELGPEPYGRLLMQHRTVMRAAFAANGGVEVDTRETPSSSRSRARREPSRPRVRRATSSHPAPSGCAWAFTPARPT